MSDRLGFSEDKIRRLEESNDEFWKSRIRSHREDFRDKILGDSATRRNYINAALGFGIIELIKDIILIDERIEQMNRMSTRNIGREEGRSLQNRGWAPAGQLPSHIEVAAGLYTRTALPNERADLMKKLKEQLMKLIPVENAQSASTAQQSRD